MELYNKFDPIGNFLSNWRNSVVRKQVKGRLIDIACGDNRLVRSHPGNGLGIDIQKFENVDLVVDDFSQIPLPNESYDTATIVASLNYFSNAREVLEEIRRILTDQCRLIITMPNSSLIKYWLKIRDPEAHRLFMPRSQIVEIIETAGFKVVKEWQFMLSLNRFYLCNKR